VVHDDAVVVVHDLGLVAELDGPPEAAFGDRTGVGVVQADSPRRPVRRGPGQPLTGLRADPPGDIQQLGQVVDRSAQPASNPTRGGVPATGSGQPGGPIRGSKNGTNGAKNTGSSSSASTRASSSGSRRTSSGSSDSHNDG
jgi:hypothetical protein